MNYVVKRFKTALIGAPLIGVVVLGGCGGSYGNMSTPPVTTTTTIGQLSQNLKLSSTVAPNGDKNPYFISTPPAAFTGINASTGVKTVLQPGDLLISNFSNSTGANTGTSIMRYTPSTTTMSLFYKESIGAGPVAGAISGLGTLWIANYLPGYTNSLDGTTTGDGNEVVVTANGTDFALNAGIIDNNSGATFPSGTSFAGPWGEVLALKAGTSTPYFFVTNVDAAGKGWIDRQQFTPGQFNKETVVTIGQLPTGTNAFGPTGPQGMAYDATNDILYVASTQDNQIVAYLNATTATTSTTSLGIVVYSGSELDAPVGLTINPINGDLIVVNQLNNNIVEIALNLVMPISPNTNSPFSARVVSVKLLDTTPVNTQNGTGSALFGVLASEDASGNLIVYYTDSITNSLNVLK